MADDNSFHFKDDFFEEILNGVPQKETPIDYEKNTKTNLNPASAMRVKHVAKAFLTSEESKNVFSSLIKTVKRKQSKNLLGKLNIKLFEEETEDDIKDEEEENIEDIAESRKQKGPVDKIFELKKKFEKLKAASKKVKKIKTQISLMKSFFLALSMKSYSDIISDRNKILREMDENFENVKEKNIDPILNQAIIPSLTTTLFSMTKKTRNFLDDLLSKYYNFMENILGFIIEKEVVKAASLVPGLGAVVKTYDFLKSRYKKARRMYRKAKGIRAVDDIAEEIVENPEIVKEVMKGGVTGFLALFGHIDENGQKKIDAGIKQMIKASKNAGTDIINNLSNSTSENNLSTEDIGILFQTGKNALNEGRTIVNNKIDEMVAIFDEKTPTHKKYDYAYKLIVSSYFKGVEHSPWTKAMMNLGNMVLFVEKHFNNMFEKLKFRVESNMVFLNKSENVITASDLTKYFKKICGEEGSFIIVKKGNKEIRINGRNKVLKSENKLPLFVKAKTIAKIYKDGRSKRYVMDFNPHIRFYFSYDLKEKYLQRDISKINFSSYYYERRNKNNNYINKKIDNEEKTSFEVTYGKNLNYKETKIKYRGQSLICDKLEMGISNKFLNAINEKHLSLRGRLLRNLFTPFTFGGSQSNNFDTKISKENASFIKDGTIAYNKGDINNYDDEKYTRYVKNYSTPVSRDVMNENRSFFHSVGLINKRDLNSLSDDVKLDVIMGKTELKWIDILSAEMIMENYSITRFKNIIYNFQTIEKENENLKNGLKFYMFDLNGPYDDIF